jgi:hypothetical protein
MAGIRVMGKNMPGRCPRLDRDARPITDPAW